MTERDESAFERELASTLERLAPKPRGDLLARATEGISRTAQRPRWLAFASRAWITLDWPRVTAVAGVVAVAMVAGVAIGTSGLLRTGDPPSRSPQPSGTASPAAVWSEPEAYSFQFEASCGERDMLGHFLVIVEHGAVIAYDSLDASPPRESVPTLGDMLARVAAARADGVAQVELETDPVDGHPVWVNIDWLPNAIDDEECYEISNYVPGVAESRTPQDSPSPPPFDWTEPTAYRFVFNDTMCGERNQLGTWQLTVRNGEVASSQPLDETAENLPPANAEPPTLGEIMSKAAGAEQSGPMPLPGRSGGLGVAEQPPIVEIETDPRDRHPIYIGIDWIPDALDDEECYRISGFEVLD
jgi:hypothetical protein